MMSAESTCAQQGVELYYFDGRGSTIKGTYNKPDNLIIVDSYLDDIEKKKVIYHELGHKDHNPANYDRCREQYEAQADRNMIYHLLKEELSYWDEDDLENFNYINFLQKYNLKTTVNETMVKEEFLNLID
ncbi:ImmA/IrrE family metallo-endopeptidase [Streptococcus gallolyticus]|uniref:ImmA/IrrE family metallo-endopeptidase n=1 Tax=Streptococcus gallolyticus TaxID=315405 RepID=UPI000E3FBBDE|nr:ImmA/IrrE family metallo-endopeptidase [Streptococcus gallolyticus]RGC38167.1 ImmA/IrrE family metallo-endopeptidase [Streptococcus gallolyticus]